MHKHETIACPRCGKLFECKIGSFYICHCSDIYLTREQAAYLVMKWEGCLCHDCLKDVSDNWSTIPEAEKEDALLFL